MEDKKALQDKELDEVSGGVQGPAQGKMKDLIRAIYDVGSALEIGEEREIIKMEKDAADLFHKK